MRTYNHQKNSFNSILNVDKSSLGLATVNKLEGLLAEKSLQKRNIIGNLRQKKKGSNI